MIIKGITLLLIFFAMLAIFGRLRFPYFQKSCPVCGKAKSECRCKRLR